MKAMKLISLALMAILFTGAFFSMGSNSTEAVASHAIPTDMSTIIQNTDSPFGEDSATCVRNWNLYDQYYRHRNFEMAWGPWRYMFEHCPRATRNIYLHGTAMAAYFFNNETDPERQDAWVDTLMMIYQRRIETFGEEGFVLGRQAARLYQVRPTRVQELYDLTERSIGLQGMSTEAPVLIINFQSVIWLTESGLLEQDAIIEAFDRATNIIDYNLETKPDDQRPFLTAKNNVRSLFEPYATCEGLIQVFGPRFEENPEDIELLHRITEMLDNAGCTAEDLFYYATKKLYELQPDAESAFLMGRLESDRENWQSAINYFQQAVDQYTETDPERHKDRIFRAYWQMAEISYRQLQRLPQARGFARQAHETSPTDGRPLILIGEMYAASASECGDDEFTRKTAFWPAVDKFNEAARVAEDEAVRNRARDLAGVYRQYFPNGEDIFFHGYSQGDSYRVECWINRTTTIRAR